jgi:hypothetical protein
MHRLIAFVSIVLSFLSNVQAQSPGPFGFGLTSCQHDGDTYTANREELVRVFFQENGVSVVNAVDQLYPDAEELRERFSDDRPEVAQLFADVVNIKQAIPGLQLKVSLPDGQTIEDLAWDIYNKQPTSEEIKKFAAAKGKQEGRKTLVRFLTIAQAEGKQTVRTGWLEQDEKSLQDQTEADTVQIIGPDGKPLGAEVVQFAIVIEHHWEVDVATGKSLDNRIKLAVGGAYTTKAAKKSAPEPTEEGAEAPEGKKAGDDSVLHQLLYQRQWTPMFRP